MILKDLNNRNVIRWLILAIVTLVILIVKTSRNGFFHGKDWVLYLILLISISFVIYYRDKNRTS